MIVAAIAAPQGIRWFENQKLAQAAHEEQTEPETSIPEKPTAGEPRAELVAKDREPAAAHPPSTPAAPPKPATAARAPSRAPATAPAQRESKSWAAQIAYAVTSSPATESAAPAPAPVPRPVAAEGTRSAAPAAPAGRFFEQRDVDESPAIATRIDPKLPGDVPARLRNDIVIVRLLVSQSGHPFRVSLLRKSKAGPSVDDAVVAAVTRWTFSPARKRGEAVSCWLNVAVPLGQAG